MKQIIQLTQNDLESEAAGPLELPQRPGATGDGAGIRPSKYFRRLKCDELVFHGDFVADEQQGLNTWDGPGGFRADTFVRPIYRAMKPERSKAEQAE